MYIYNPAYIYMQEKNPASKHPGAEVPPPSFDHARSSSSACPGSLCESRTNSHLTARPRTRRFPAGLAKGCSALALCSGTSPRAPGMEEGLEANVLFTFPFILPLPTWHSGGEHPLGKGLLTGLRRAHGPRPRRSGHAPRSCRRFIRCWKGPKDAFPFEKRV